jgi:hypothetical protein
LVWSARTGGTPRASTIPGQDPNNSVIAVVALTAKGRGSDDPSLGCEAGLASDLVGGQRKVGYLQVEPNPTGADF